MRPFGRLIAAIILGIAAAACSPQAQTEDSFLEPQEQGFRWTESALLRAQVEPAIIESLGLPIGGGGARVEPFDSPQNQDKWIAGTIPDQCFAIDSAISGSATFGDELVLIQFTDSAMSEKWMSLTVRTFPDEESASQRMSEIANSASSCGIYASLDTSGSSKEWEMWNEVLVEEQDFVLTLREGDGYFKTHDVIAFGRVGSALYVLWLMYPSLDLKPEETIADAKQLRHAVTRNLELAQG